MAHHASPNSLLHPALPVLGREVEFETLSQWLDAHSVRSITIWGPPGIGKTTLATCFGSQALGQSRVQKARICSCVEVHSTEDFLALVLQTLELPANQLHSAADHLEAIERYLQACSHELLILDNLEHLQADLQPFLTRWLHADWAINIMVTTRSLVGLNSQQTLALGPLDKKAALQLFVDRAQRVRPHFDGHLTQVSELEKLMNKLDGHPLAIELIAARSNLQSPSQLLRRFERDLLYYEQTFRTLSPLHRTVATAIEASWTLLDARQKSLLQQIALFEGPFTVETAEAVLRLPPEASPSLDELSETEYGGATTQHTPRDTSLWAHLDSLIQQAWLRSEEDSFGQISFSMLLVICEFVRQKSHPASGLSTETFTRTEISDPTSPPFFDRDIALERFMRFFVFKARHFDQQAVGPEGTEWLQWLITHRATLFYLADYYETQDPDRSAQLRAIVPWLQWTGMVGLERCSEIVDRALHLLSPQASPALSRLLRYQKQFLEVRTRYRPETLKTLDELYQEAAAAEEWSLAVRIEHLKSHALSSSQRKEEAVVSAKKAVALAQEHQLRALEGLSAAMLGYCLLHEARDLQEALRVLRSAVNLLKHSSNQSLILFPLSNLGVGEMLAGQLKLAQNSLAQVQEQSRQPYSRRIHLNAHYYQGIVRFRLGESETGLAMMLEALEDLIKIGTAPNVIHGMFYVGMCLSILGRHREAIQWFVKARQTIDESGHVTLLTLTLACQAQAHIFLEEWDKSLSLFERSKQLVRECDMGDYDVFAMIMAFGLDCHLGHPDQAKESYELIERCLTYWPPALCKAWLQGVITELRQWQADIAQANALSPLTHLETLPINPLIELYFLKRVLRHFVDLSKHFAQAGEDLLLKYDPVKHRLVLPDDSVVSLRRRNALRRIVAALIDNHRTSPSEPISVYNLFDLGWPGESIDPDVAAQRIYLNMSRLRGLGLEEYLITEEGGYRLNPLTQIEHVDTA